MKASLPKQFGLGILLLVPLVALAHGGGLDKCGGHKNKKQGGYHVHNTAMYCKCNPSAEQCKAATSIPTDKKK